MYKHQVPANHIRLVPSCHRQEPKAPRRYLAMKWWSQDLNLSRWLPWPTHQASFNITPCLPSPSHADHLDILQCGPAHLLLHICTFCSLHWELPSRLLQVDSSLTFQTQLCHLCIEVTPDLVAPDCTYPPPKEHFLHHFSNFFSHLISLLICGFFEARCDVFRCP